MTEAAGWTTAKSGEAGAGEVDEPIEIGGVRITPGCSVWSDPDSILVAPPDAAG
jgi:regulator of RNase E activity RraA